MTYKTEIIEIEQHCCGYSLVIDDFHVGNYKSMEKLIEYLSSRLRSDFN